MNEDQKAKMRWYMFWVFMVLFIIVSILTISALFFDFGQLESKYKDNLTWAFVLEVGGAVVALFYSIFDIKRPQTQEPKRDEKQSTSTPGNIRDNLTTNERRIYRALMDEPYGRLIANYTRYYGREIDRLIENGMVVKGHKGRYKLTESGMASALAYMAEYSRNT